MKTAVPLTPKEKTTLEYIESFIGDHGFSPTFTEIKDHFGYASYNSVQRYLKQLEKKGYVHLPGGNQKRAIQVLQSSSSYKSNVIGLAPPTRSPKPAKRHFQPSESFAPETVSIPLLGDVAAGIPIESIHSDEHVGVPLTLVKDVASTFALKVQGESMIEDGILDGDTVLVQSASTAVNGETVVAVVDSEATIKRIFFHSSNPKGNIELRPANSSMQSMWFKGNEVEIKGKLTGLIREF
ncbi:MAG: repressor LexA [Bdellovibrionaceae bacterium]|nr:repressor LexA [Pseudobdellovibrionaceae bacterium]|tara:strand:+ start:640 stop:1356 length:717 start_codon:yes stop_codon:yes gene_type:complete